MIRVLFALQLLASSPAACTPRPENVAAGTRALSQDKIAWDAWLRELKTRNTAEEALCVLRALLAKATTPFLRARILAAMEAIAPCTGVICAVGTPMAGDAL